MVGHQERKSGISGISTNINPSPGLDFRFQGAAGYGRCLVPGCLSWPIAPPGIRGWCMKSLQGCREIRQLSDLIEITLIQPQNEVDLRVFSLRR